MKKYKYIQAAEDVPELNQKIIDALEDLDWIVRSPSPIGNDIYVEIENMSDLGEDLVEDIEYGGTDKDFIDNAIEVLSSFDPDDHAEMWIEERGQNGVPDSIRDLIDDADSIKELYDDTCVALRKI